MVAKPNRPIRTRAVVSRGGEGEPASEPAQPPPRWGHSRRSGWASWSGIPQGEKISFRLDSVVKVSSAAAVACQFSAHDHAVCESREKTTLRIFAVSLFALAGYATVDAVRALTGTGEAGQSIPGIVLASPSLAVIPFLSAVRRKANRELGSASVVADSKHTPLCTYLSAVPMVGLVLVTAGCPAEMVQVPVGPSAARLHRPPHTDGSPL